MTEILRKAMAREGMTWPSWYDGAADHGPIAERYHAQSFPWIFVIDAKGIIRRRNPSRVDQDLVDKLLDKMKRPTPPQQAIAWMAYSRQLGARRWEDVERMT